jgi:AtzE family amidohydrolase
MMLNLDSADATTIVRAIQSGEFSAEEIISATLERIAVRDGQLNAFTHVFPEKAIAAARSIDHRLALGQNPGPLAGVPFAVKNLLDIAGIATLAGSRLSATTPPAQEDAPTIRALKEAGAILIGSLNMDEFAYGFTTENSHYGVTRNPHDLSRIAGGSSGGSAAAVAAGLVPISIGSDTNGSTRVPAALCGVLGLKPTYGRISRRGAALFVSSLDHIGVFARSVRDLALTFDLLQTPDPLDPVCTTHPTAPTHPQLYQGIQDCRVAVAEGYFTEGVEPEILTALEQVAQALKAQKRIQFPEPERARAAAHLITASEGAQQHLLQLRTQAQDFDPATRDRFLAGSLLPAQWYLQAQRFRSWYQHQVKQLFETVDLILTPTTPCRAPVIGQSTIRFKNQEVSTRSNLGALTQPFSLIGLPALSIPLDSDLPVGIQLVAAPNQDSLLLRAAAFLEQEGVLACRSVFYPQPGSRED